MANVFAEITSLCRLETQHVLYRNCKGCMRVGDISKKPLKNDPALREVAREATALRIIADEAECAYRKRVALLKKAGIK